MDCLSICEFAPTCKKAGAESCNQLCYPFVFLHGEQGHTGIWNAMGVPKKYKSCKVSNLPIATSNPKAYAIIKKYAEESTKFVFEKGIGLFLFSVPNPDNRFGTGTGKTTSATTIQNEFTIQASREHLKGERILDSNPSLFMKASALQNKYNEQFRGAFEMQQQASASFYKLKKKMKTMPLLVIDDIAMRDITQAFENELYEIIDSRATEELATIFTSNLAMAELGDIIGDRIASRIDGMTVKVPFGGQDNRKGGLF